MLFTKLADKKKNIYDEDLLAIIHDGIRMIPERYHLKYVHATGGNQVLASATVKLSKDNEFFVDTALGCGPVEATYRAIDQITGVPGRLLDYSVRSVSSGKDAVGEVFVHVHFEGQRFTGKAASSDLVDASARAYLNAVNKDHPCQGVGGGPETDRAKAAGAPGVVTLKRKAARTIHGIQG